MYEALFGSVNCERVLLYLGEREEGYGREIAAFWEAPLAPLQRQLDKLEAGGLLRSKLLGRVRLYRWNPRYPLLRELRQLLRRAVELLPEEERRRLQYDRRRPRRRGKPL